ncbi:ABC transporter substrate-binding protein [uncultured Amnibacterium sp.]|uniref:ABC transporter substrate-binding protein n=1 Tax=uncultured Amnibacterium sp. TaxID=1631851 RepID=UPI0035CBCF7B
MSRTRVRPHALVAAAAAVALLLTGCSTAATPGGSGTSSSGAAGGTYRLGLTAPGGNIDPLTTADYNAMFIVGLASAGLIIQSPTGKLEPQLATSWKPSSDGLTWTVELRSGAKFSDGSAVTPADVVSSFEAIIAEKSQSPAKSSFAGVLKSVAAGDGDTVDFTLDQPYQDFPYLLTGANTAILPKGTDTATWIKDPVGAGQFVVKQYTAGQGVTFVKNTNYWDAAKVELDGVDVKFYSDEQSQLLAFQSGETDQISQSPAVAAALNDSNSTLTSQGWTKYDGLTFNTTKAPFDDVKVRQAVAWALDRNAIVKTVYGGAARIGNDVSTFPDYGVQPTGLTQRNQDAAKVKELLGGKTVSFTITTYDGEQAYAELIQQQLQAVGGFKVTLKVQTGAQYYGGDNDTTPWLNADATVTDWAERLPSQLIGLSYQTGAIWNAAHYSNTELDALAKQYEQAADAGERQTIADKIATIQWNDVPTIIAAFKKNGLYLGKQVKGAFQNGQQFSGGFDFRGVTVSR